MIFIGQRYPRFTAELAGPSIRQISTEPGVPGHTPEGPQPIGAEWDGTALHITWEDGDVSLIPAASILTLVFHGAATQ